jgi:4-aminobutyrate aminotransferase-like enzyme
MNLPEKVGLIEKTITGCLAPLAEIDIAVRGRGALWIVEAPSTLHVDEIVSNIYGAGVCVGYTGRQIRILPPATVEMANLERACVVVTRELVRAHHG